MYYILTSLTPAKTCTGALRHYTHYFIPSNLAKTADYINSEPRNAPNIKSCCKSRCAILHQFILLRKIFLKI